MYRNCHIAGRRPLFHLGAWQTALHSLRRAFTTNLQNDGMTCNPRNSFRDSRPPSFDANPDLPCLCSFSWSPAPHLPKAARPTTPTIRDTPGNLNWEINLGYMPFLYSDQSVSHTPDLDINFGVGDRIQLTYENAWLRVQNPAPRLSMAWVNPIPASSGVSTMPVSRVSPSRFSRSSSSTTRMTPSAAGSLRRARHFFCPLSSPGNLARSTWITKSAISLSTKDRTAGSPASCSATTSLQNSKCDMEFYSQGTFHPSEYQPTIGLGARYKIHRPVILLFMAGRSLEPAASNQSYFVGYFGIQFLLPPKSYKAD